MEQLNHQEYVLGYGGQLDSFDAVFSPRGVDGRPRPVIHKLTGAIDRDVAEYWRRYDIRQVLQDNWATLGPRLQGKLHVIAGAWDSFYLDGGVILLREFLATRPHGGYVEVLPGDHGSVLTPAVRARIEREMAERSRVLPGAK